MARSSSGGGSRRSGINFAYTDFNSCQLYSVERMTALSLTAMTWTATEAPLDGPEDFSRVIEAAKSGDLAAFETVIRRYERLVLVTALRLSGNLPDAQD